MGLEREKAQQKRKAAKEIAVCMTLYQTKGTFNATSDPQSQ